MWLEKFQFHLFEKKPVNDQHTMYMRNACFKALVLVLALFGLASAAIQSHAQTIETLVQFTNSWRYNATGTNFGAAWRSNSFSDAAWPQGRAMFGYEPDAASIANYNTVIGITPTSTPFNTPFAQLNTVTTMYFRTTFTLNGSLAGISLIASNLVDDSLVIHLNGAEVGRLRVPAGQTATTQASGGAATEGANEPITLSNLGTALRVGQNLLAVEVHGTMSGSYDSAFGMKLMAIRPTTLAITNQPDSQTVSVGDPVSFVVGVSGGPAIYRWQKDGVNLTSTSNTLAIASVQVANAGNYQVIISNSVSSVTSGVAVLTVTADTDGPKVLQAIVDNGFGTNSVNVKFDENLTTATARSTNNFRLVPVSNPNISIHVTNILYSSALGALLQISTSDVNWNPRGSYYLVINGVSDSRGNNIAPNTVIGVSLLNTTNLTQMSDHWDFYANAFFDPAWPGVYSQFHKTNFIVDPTYWGNNPQDGGIFWFDNNATAVLCGGDILGRQISDQDTVPTLFRRTFRLPVDFGRTATFKLRYMVDDGFVLYLNGVEITRQNMPSSAVSATTIASSPVALPICSTNLSINVINLLPGTNWLAAAVHQANPSDNDIYFGLEMDVVSSSTSSAPTNRPPGTPTLTRAFVTNAQGRASVLSWPATNYGYSLLYSTDIVGTGARPDQNWWTNQANWTQVPNQSNPFTNAVPATGPRRFYKLYRETLN